MPPIISAQGLAKRYGAAPLFTRLSFTISEGERIGIIGPNGSGKSTLLEMLSGGVSPDSGDVAIRKGTRMSVVKQSSEYAAGDTVQGVLEKAMISAKVPEAERPGVAGEVLGRAGFTDFSAAAMTLSGGWRKRLSIAEALVQQPDILLLDEPTNHLDLEGIEWLESVLMSASFACAVVSHDRYFLENVANEIVEINRTYDEGAFRVSGNYSAFLEAKEEYLHAQRNRQSALENRVRTEIDWLRRGPKARTTKSKARIDNAHKMIGELAELGERTRSGRAQIDFSASDRKTKQLITLDDVRYSVGERVLFEGLHFIVTSGMRVGLVGPNGSGKTTLLRLMKDDLQPANGTIRRAETLRIVYFDQNRQLDPQLTLKRALAPDSDSVIYREQVIHVAAWAARFLFTGEQLNQRVGRLSGGERARVLIAQLMLERADVLLLDEPTNDLDIPTLEILEESLLDYPGAVVLVTHDRYMLDRLSTVVLGLDGKGRGERFADFLQWEAWLQVRANQQKEIRAEKNAGAAGRPEAGAGSIGAGSGPAKSTDGKKKISYKEAQELAGIEQRIADAEKELQAKHDSLLDPAVLNDAQQLRLVSLELEHAQKTIELLYARWTELEQKQGQERP